MNWNTKEIFEILKEVLGEKADGIYISYDNVDMAAEDLFYSDSDLSSPICNTFDVMVKTGLTRICLVPNEKDYVIKLPITGVYGNIHDEYGCGNVEECDIKMYVDLDEYNVFDYEQAIYNSLLSESKEVFCPCTYIGNFNGIPVYVQPKIEKIQYDVMSFLNEEEVKAVSALTSRHHYKDSVDRPLTDDFIMKLINLYGEEAAGYILEDCKQIDDLHTNNYGYTSDGKPIIFDFAGFNGEMYAW